MISWDFAKNDLQRTLQSWCFGSDSEFSNKSEAYKFLFKKVNPLKTKSNSFPRAEGSSLGKQVKAEDSHVILDNLDEWTNFSLLKLKTSIDHELNSFSEHSFKNWVVDYKSEYSQNYDPDKGWIVTYFQRSSDVALSNSENLKNKAHIAIDSSTSAADRQQPWVVLSTADIDGLLAQNISQEESCSGQIEDVKDEKPKHSGRIERELDEIRAFAVNLKRGPERNKATLLKNSKTDPADIKPRRYNSFALGRTCFRWMSSYYKTLFEPKLKEWEEIADKENRISMDSLVSLFIAEEFEQNSRFYHSTNPESFLEWMITILHSHNHKKKDDYIRRRDFKRIRNLLYWYSANAKKIFLKDLNYAVIFNNFYEKWGIPSVKERWWNKSQDYIDEIVYELKDINTLALKYISSNI